jgi:uncharacterized membrane protein YfcA
MVCHLGLTDWRRGGRRSVGFSAAMVTLLVPLFRLASQPEIICDQQSERNHGEADDHQHGSAFFFAALCGILSGTFGVSGGFFG